MKLSGQGIMTGWHP